MTDDLPQVLTPINDVPFKKLFESKLTAREFINAAFRDENKVQEIVEVITDSSYMPENVQGKTCVADVVCKGINNDSFLVEMQMARYPGFLNRITFYSSRMYVDRVLKGKDYKIAAPVYVIVICNYNLLPEEDWYSFHQNMSVSKLQKRIGETVTDEMINEIINSSWKNFEYVFLQLPKYEKPDVQIGTLSKVELWILFFKEELDNTEKTFLKTHYPILDSAFENLKKVNYSEAELRQYRLTQDSLFVNNTILAEEARMKEEVERAKEEAERAKEAERATKRKMKDDLEAILQEAEASGVEALAESIRTKLSRFN